MPVYEYKCKVCDERFDIEQSITEDALTTLQGCVVDPSGDHRLKKVFHAVGIAFKGEGFYRNDSRSSSAKPDAPASGSGSDSSSDSTSTSSADSSSDGSNTSSAESTSSTPESSKTSS